VLYGSALLEDFFKPANNCRENFLGVNNGLSTLVLLFCLLYAFGASCFGGHLSGGMLLFLEIGYR